MAAPPSRKRRVDWMHDEMEIMPIGAGNEVGRSCILLKFKGKTILLDCGIHPGYNGEAALPFFDEINPGEIDLLLITHFHLDHAASLPYFTEHTDFKGRIFMTHPTKAVMKMLLADYMKVSTISTDDMLYDEKDLQRCIEKIELIDYHQNLEVNGIRFWCYSAGHVLGAAMFMIQIAGVRVLYTGDYSRETDRHLMSAETPSISPEVLIVESTYGVQVHEPRPEREARFTGLIERVVRRGGRCLVPVFALGRAQELLLILEEYWESHPSLQHIPVYYASKLASRALTVYQTYIYTMNDKIRRQVGVKNPFQFRHISNLRSSDRFEDSGPCVVMASPGMLQSGFSRELFERWCVDPKNGCVIPGYCVEGTLAKKILTEPSDITSMSGRLLPLNCSVQYMSFSAHCDFVQTSEFVHIMRPHHVVMVHGEANEMRRQKSALSKKFAKWKRLQLHSPLNCETVQLEFRKDKVAKTIGSLAQQLPAAGGRVSGVLVTKNFNTFFMSPSEVATYTQLRTHTVRQQLHLPCHVPFSLVHTFLSQVFDAVVGGESEEHSSSGIGFPQFTVCNCVTVTQRPPDRVRISWAASPRADMVADSVMALLSQAETGPACVALTSSHCTSHASHTPPPPQPPPPPPSAAEEGATQAAAATAAPKGSKQPSEDAEEAAAAAGEGKAETVADSAVPSPSGGDGGIQQPASEAAAAAAAERRGAGWSTEQLGIVARFLSEHVSSVKVVSPHTLLVRGGPDAVAVVSAVDKSVAPYSAPSEHASGRGRGEPIGESAAAPSAPPLPSSPSDHTASTPTAGTAPPPPPSSVHPATIKLCARLLLLLRRVDKALSPL